MDQAQTQGSNLDDQQFHKALRAFLQTATGGAAAATAGIAAATDGVAAAAATDSDAAGAGVGAEIATGGGAAGVRSGTAGATARARAGAGAAAGAAPARARARAPARARTPARSRCVGLRPLARCHAYQEAAVRGSERIVVVVVVVFCSEEAVLRIAEATRNHARGTCAPCTAIRAIVNTCTLYAFVADPDVARAAQERAPSPASSAASNDKVDTTEVRLSLGPHAVVGVRVSVERAPCDDGCGAYKGCECVQEVEDSVDAKRMVYMDVLIDGQLQDAALDTFCVLTVS